MEHFSIYERYLILMGTLINVYIVIQIIMVQAKSLINQSIMNIINCASICSLVLSFSSSYSRWIHVNQWIISRYICFIQATSGFMNLVIMESVSRAMRIIQTLVESRCGHVQSSLCGQWPWEVHIPVDSAR